LSYGYSAKQGGGVCPAGMIMEVRKAGPGQPCSSLQKQTTNKLLYETPISESEASLNSGAEEP